MAAFKGTINKTNGQSSVLKPLDWSSFDSGPNNCYFDMNGVDASKMVILMAGASTIVCGLWIGTSDSRASHNLATKTSMQYPYSAGKHGRMKMLSTIEVVGASQNAFLSTKVADTETLTIFAAGPFETARFKDSDGYINVCRAKAGDQDTIESLICAILLP